MILHRVGVGDAAVRTGRVGKTVDLFLALAAYREHDFTAVAVRNGACGESFPLVVRQQHYADRVEIGRASCRERVGQSGEISRVAVSSKKKNQRTEDKDNENQH